MRKGKVVEKFKRILISIMCVVTLVFAMPVKAKAGIFEDFVDLILKIPDGVMFIANWWLADRSPSGAIDTMASVGLKGVHGGPWGRDDDGYIYNFHVTPYDIFTCGEVREYKDSSGNEHSFRNLPIFYANFFNTSDGINADNDSYALKSNEILRPVISNVYKYLRNLCVVLMMLVLLYMGIRIIVSSVSSEQAKYKNMLVDWLVGISLLFLMHYIMSFIMNVNDVIVDMLQNNESANYYICFGRLGDYNGWGEEWYEFFDDYDDKTFIDLHLDIPGNASDSENGKWQDTGILFWHKDGAESSVPEKGFDFDKTNATIQLDTHTDWGDNGLVKINAYIDGDENDKYHICVYRANLMEYVRTISSYSQSFVTMYTNNHGGATVADTDDSDLMAKMGYGILYIALVVETVMFSVVYFKRLLQLAFLTMIAPLVAFMYPIDKVGDGKAQAFNTWLKDYIFNVLIQPLHLLIYTIFVTAAMDLFAKNILYALAVYAFMIVAEKYFKKIFGFDKASSGGGGPLGSALGAGMAMHGLGKLTGLGPPGAPGGGKNSNGADGGKGNKIKIKKRDPKKDKPDTKTSTNGNGTGDGTGDGQLPGALPGGKFSKAKNAIKNTGKAAFGTGKKKIARALTGGKYNGMKGKKGKFVAAALKNGLGKGVRLATRVGSTAALGSAGLLAGAATAIATGDVNNLTKGIAIGTAAGWKNGKNFADWGGNKISSLVNDTKALRAETDEEYAGKLRAEQAKDEFNNDLTTDEEAIIEKYAPIIDFNGDEDKLKAIMDADANGYSEEQIKQAESDSKSWKDLKTKSDHESYLKFQANERMAEIKDSDVKVTQNEVQQQAKLDKQEKVKQAEKKREEAESKYDKEIVTAKEAGNIDRAKKLERKKKAEVDALEKEVKDAQKAKYDTAEAEQKLREQKKRELAEQKAEEDYQRALRFQQKSKKTSK